MTDEQAGRRETSLLQVGDLEGILALRARIAGAVIRSRIPPEAGAVLPSAASAIVAAYMAAGHRSVGGSMELRPDGGIQILLEGGGPAPGDPVVDPPMVALPPHLPGGVLVQGLDGGARWSISAAGSSHRSSPGGAAALYEVESALLQMASSGGAPSAPPIPVSDLLDELRAAFQGRARRGGIALEVHPPAQELSVEGERDRLFGLLSDMVGNAFRFSREGDGITVTAVEEEGGVRITVSDTGPGMPPEVLDGLFAWEWRPGGPPPPAGGPGFALARRGAEAMGGRFLAESRLGEGTRVHLVLRRG